LNPSSKYPKVQNGLMCLAKALSKSGTLTIEVIFSSLFYLPSYTKLANLKGSRIVIALGRYSPRKSFGTKEYSCN
jgi:hypothetical protein